MSITYWKPFNALKSPSSNNFVFILLNQPIQDWLSEYFTHLWSNALVRICADGASNRLYQWSKSRQEKFIPDYIIGDLDSTHQELRDYYQNQGSKVFKVKCQDSTDFTKCLRFASECLKNSDFTNFSDLQSLITKRIEFNSIYCFCGFGGRFDHAMSNINSLFLPCIRDLCTYIVSDESFTFLLKKGTNLIYFKNDNFSGKYCGYFPVGSPTKVTTKGLKWDLENATCTFGGIVSSSNEYDTIDDYITIETENELLWTMSIKVERNE
jgi:thiamine pyrophosphokinase